MIDLPEVIASITATTAIVAGLGVVMKKITEGKLKSHFDKDLERTKSELKVEGDARLESLKLENAKETARLTALLDRIERIEADLLDRRVKSYGKIWQLTGRLNLFGPTESPVDGSELSSELKEWYFTDGVNLSRDSAARYFLVQEILNFALLKGIDFIRPANETLYGESHRRTTEIANDLRLQHLGIPLPDRSKDDFEYAWQEIADAVDLWKAHTLDADSRPPSDPEASWLLLQFALSSLRTRIFREISSEDAASDAAAAGR